VAASAIPKIERFRVSYKEKFIRKLPNKYQEIQLKHLVVMPEAMQRQNFQLRQEKIDFEDTRAFPTAIPKIEIQSIIQGKLHKKAIK
jgi:hypothetical protein